MKKFCNLKISDHRYMAEIVNLLFKYAPDTSVGKPAKIVDIGCGRGLLGFQLKTHFGKGVIVHGIDADFEEYFLPTVRTIYDKIARISIQEFCKLSNTKYDAIVAAHIMEHIIFEEALHILKLLKSHSDCIIISVPKRPHKNKAYNQEPNLHSHKWGIDDEKTKLIEEIGYMKEINPKLLQVIFVYKKEE